MFWNARINRVSAKTLAPNPLSSFNFLQWSIILLENISAQIFILLRAFLSSPSINLFCGFPIWQVWKAESYFFRERWTPLESSLNWNYTITEKGDRPLKF